jgi:ABC-type polar amino acid transport system ATPase subunit
MIEVQGLCKRFGAVDVLSELSLSVEKGKVAAIGPSGGKSTFLFAASTGSSRSNAAKCASAATSSLGCQRGQRAERLRAIRRKVGFVFQQFNLFPHLDVMGNIVEAPQRVLRQARASSRPKRCASWNAWVSPKEACPPPRALRGQQQRVAIARALAMRPKSFSSTSRRARSTR